MDAAPVIKFSEHVFDLVALPIERGVVRDWHFAVLLRRDAGGNFAFCECGAKPVCVIASVAEQGFGLGQGVDHQCRPFVVAHLPFAQQHDQRSAFAVADRVELGVQAAFGASDTSGSAVGQIMIRGIIIPQAPF